MTNEQAIDILDSLVGMLSINNVPADEALKMGISALEKQVPKCSEKSDAYIRCVCGAKYKNFKIGNSREWKYCPYCGQAIEWDESR